MPVSDHKANNSPLSNIMLRFDSIRGVMTCHIKGRIRNEAHLKYLKFLRGPGGAGP